MGYTRHGVKKGKMLTIRFFFYKFETILIIMLTFDTLLSKIRSQFFFISSSQLFNCFRKKSHQTASRPGRFIPGFDYMVQYNFFLVNALKIKNSETASSWKFRVRLWKGTLDCELPLRRLLKYLCS